MTRRRRGEVVVLRYITTDRRIEVAWPCRVVEDSAELLALFIARGTMYRNRPKLTAAQKLTGEQSPLPPGDDAWRHDTLRLMFPDVCHSVWLFWDGAGDSRRLLRYFVNLEEPFRRTPVGFDTQDHTLDVVVTPDLACSWRDEDDFENHVALGFYTRDLAAAARAEGQRVIDAIARGTHPCLQGWARWSPEPGWSPPEMPEAWSTTPATSWKRRRWAYGAASD